jgi:hypothetical protein
MNHFVEIFLKVLPLQTLKFDQKNQLTEPTLFNDMAAKNV